MKKTFCQSCGMPLEKKADYGTEKDGSQSIEFCHYCYGDGKYLQPDITMEEMKAIGLKGISENPDFNKGTKAVLKMMYPFQLKNLKRWQKPKSKESLIAGTLFLLAGILFIISAIIGKNITFISLGCCFIILGIVFNIKYNIE